MKGRKEYPKDRLKGRLERRRKHKKRIDYLADMPGYYKVMNEGIPQAAEKRYCRLSLEISIIKTSKESYKT